MIKSEIIHQSNQPSQSLFSLIKTPVLSYLIHFLTPEECFESKKICKAVYKAFYYLYGHWVRELKEIASEYHLSISFNQIDFTKETAILKQRMYPMKEHKGLFIQIGEAKVRFYTLFNSVEFAWSNDPSYWIKTSYPDSVLKGPSYTLKSVCWVDPKLSLFHVKPKNYNLYLRHGLKALRKNELKVTVFINSKSIYNESYPTQHMIKDFDEKVRSTWDEISNYQKVNLIDSLLCKINKHCFDTINSLYGGNEIRVEFLHNNQWWKSGWIIDALYLEEDD